MAEEEDEVIEITAEPGRRKRGRPRKVRVDEDGVVIPPPAPKPTAIAKASKTKPTEPAGPPPRSDGAGRRMCHAIWIDKGVPTRCNEKSVHRYCAEHAPYADAYDKLIAAFTPGWAVRTSAVGMLPDMILFGPPAEAGETIARRVPVNEAPKGPATGGVLPDRNAARNLLRGL